MAAENFKVKKGLEVGTGITANSDGVNVTGIITATQFKGDGSGLTGVVGSGSGVVIKDEGSTVGTAGTINFVGSGIAAAISEGTATVTLSAGSLNNIVEDTTPQLGGNLDLNSKFITGSGNIDITGSLDVSGISTFAGITTVTGETLFTKQLNVTGVSTFGNNINASGTSRFEIASMENGVLDGEISHNGDATTKIKFPSNNNISFDTDGTTRLNINNSGANITGVITATGANITGIATFTGGVAKLLFNGNQKLITTINGIEVPDLNVTGVGTIGRMDTNGVTLGTNSTTFAAKFADNARAIFGGATQGDFGIYHDTNHSYLQRIPGGTGDIYMMLGGDNAIIAKTDNSVELYWDDAKKLETDSAGVKITGVCTATSFSGDGSGLTGITASGSGIIVKHDGSTVGTAGTINFSTNLDVSAISAGIVTVTASGGGGVTSDAQGNTVGGTNSGDSFSGTDAIHNTLYGFDTGTAITTADRTTAVGYQALKTVSTSIMNSAFGYASLRETTGQRNNAFGSSAGIEVTSGIDNCFFGCNSGSYCGGSSRNTGVGNDSLYRVGQGGEGNYNTGVGYKSLYNVRSGDNNTAIGYQSGDDLTGSNNIVIGANAAASSATVSNEITLGDTNITKLRVPGIGLTFTSIGAEVSGIVTATSFSGSGASLTSLDAGNLGVGTIPNGRFPATLPAVSGANLTSLTAGNISGTLPAISGANLTNLTAGNISGTLSSSQIADDAVTFAKMQNVGTGVFIGRNDGGTGNIETLTAAEARTLLNVADGATAGITTSPSNIVATWNVVNNGASSYRFTGPGQSPTADNPDIYLVRGKTYRFALSASGHPFQIRVSNGGSAYNDGVTNNGAQTGNVEFYVQSGAPASLVYQCTSHGGMVGNIYIIGGIQVGGATTLGSNSADGVVDLQRAGTSRLMTETFGISVNGDIMYQDALVHIGDTDTRIRFPANDTITAETAGTERLRIESNGDVEWNNIGTPTPGYNNSTVGMGFEPRNGTIFLSRADNLLIHANRNNDGRFIGFAQGGALKFNIGLQNSGADLTFNSGTAEGTERLRILSDGRIGINTTTVFDTNTMLQVTGKTGAGPNLVLHRNDTSVSQNQVLAALRVTGNDSDGTQQESSAIEFVADADHGTGDKPGRLVFKTTNDGASSSTEKVRITESGRVGILETNPQSPLQVKGGIRSAQTPGNGHIDLKHDGSNGSLVSSYGSFLFYNTVDTGEYFFHTKSSNSQVMKITADGTLEVKHSGGGNGVAINGISGEDVGVIRQRADNHHAIILRGSSNADGSTITGGNTMEFREYGDFVFKTGTGTMAERIRIMNSELKLTCHQTFNADNTYYIGTNGIKAARAYSHMFVYREGTGGSVSGGGQTAEVIKFGSEGITMLHDSITLSTAATFSAMTGNRAGALLRMRNNTGPVIYSENGAVTVANASDYRIKENIVGITSAMSTVKKLNPVSYNIKKSWNPDDKGDRIQGFIAHEVQEVITDNAGVVLGKKDAVNPDGSVDAQGIDYAKLTPVLTAAVKELIAEVETLKAEVAALKSS